MPWIASKEHIKGSAAVACCWCYCHFANFNYTFFKFSISISISIYIYHNFSKVETSRSYPPRKMNPPIVINTILGSAPEYNLLMRTEQLNNKQLCNFCHLYVPPYSFYFVYLFNYKEKIDSCKFMRSFCEHNSSFGYIYWISDYWCNQACKWTS